MAIRINQNRMIKVIDRTLPEIIKPDSKTGRLDLLVFCLMLKASGVDLIEINGDVLKKIRKLPPELDFIFRLGQPEDFALIAEYRLKKCIVDAEMLHDQSHIDYILKNGLELAVEFRVDGLAALDGVGGILELVSSGIVENIRLTGFERCTGPAWAENVSRLKNTLGIQIDICAENHFCNAVATALEAIMSGMEFISASLMGFGRERSYAPLEEVLSAASIVIGGDIGADLKLLPRLGECFTSFTGVAIPDNKPVLGSNIFKYESGIHADGIHKNPETYEPYNPHFVGQERKLSIGKHSGKKSVANKIKELGLAFAENKMQRILDRIREESILLGRDLGDDEIKKIVSCFVKKRDAWEALLQARNA